MNLPQILYIGLNMIGFGVHLAKHGQPREDKYNAGTAFVSLMIEIGLLWWGGFFNG